ncbi:MAG: hypothetical protein OEW15_17990 [Nitrospirota bacterium]|nr:hypothetical protein [Nitrospirota bacterium]
MSDQESELIVSYLTLRKMIGWIGLLMPVSVRLGAWIFEGIRTTDSISAYYYTGMRDVFVSTLVLVGILLTCYRTRNIWDNVLSIVSGIAAIGIGLFPIEPTFAAEVLQKFPDMGSEKCYVNRGLLGYHFIFVSTFFALSFYMVYFRFRAFTPGSPTRQKLIRNSIYKWCGLAMLAAFIMIGYLAVFNKGASIFWPETIAVVAFATAWVVKGRIILKDPVA